MQMRSASERASASSERGTLALSAVTATARSPSAKWAAWATTVLSIPPLNATAAPGISPRIASNRSRFAANSPLMPNLERPVFIIRYRAPIAPDEDLTHRRNWIIPSPFRKSGRIMRRLAQILLVLTLGSGGWALPQARDSTVVARASSYDSSNEMFLRTDHPGPEAYARLFETVLDVIDQDF